jgi:outer membrane lipoprotein
MRRLIIIVLVSMALSSCAPVLKQELMSKGGYYVPFAEIVNKPIINRGRLFILGGIIVNTKATKEGSLIEAVYVPVNSMGHLKDAGPSNIRFLAIYPKDRGLLDPMIYSSEREITLAGEFIGTRSGEIGEMEYTYPFFEIKDLHLWEERKDYYYIDPLYSPWHYPGRHYDPWYYGPYWRHDPWWRY